MTPSPFDSIPFDVSFQQWNDLGDFEIPEHGTRREVRPSSRSRRSAEEHPDRRGDPRGGLGRYRETVPETLVIGHHVGLGGHGEGEA